MALGALRAVPGMYRQLRRAFKVLGCLGDWLQASNGILQGCPFSVVFINMLTTVWKRGIDTPNAGFKVQVRSQPPRREVDRQQEVPSDQGPCFRGMMAKSAQTSPPRGVPSAPTMHPVHPPLE